MSKIECFAKMCKNERFCEKNICFLKKSVQKLLFLRKLDIFAKKCAKIECFGKIEVFLQKLDIFVKNVQK